MGRNIFDLIGDGIISLTKGLEPILRAALNTLLNALKGPWLPSRSSPNGLAYQALQKAQKATDQLPDSHFGTKRASASQLPKVKKSLQGQPSESQRWLEEVTRVQNRLERDMEKHLKSVDDQVAKINELAKKANVSIMIERGTETVKLPILDNDTIGVWGKNDQPTETKYVTMTISELIERFDNSQKKRKKATDGGGGH